MCFSGVSNLLLATKSVLSLATSLTNMISTTKAKSARKLIKSFAERQPKLRAHTWIRLLFQLTLSRALSLSRWLALPFA